MRVNDVDGCVATVRRLGGSGKPSRLAGTVRFTSSLKGQFNHDTCSLHQVPQGASCSVTYTPAENGEHTLTARYEGDERHAPSDGDFGLQVGEKTSTTISCKPNPVGVNDADSCSATVHERGSSARPSRPSGVVKFASSSKGSFGQDSCSLHADGEHAASCSVAYTAAETHAFRRTYALFPH